MTYKKETYLRAINVLYLYNMSDEVMILHQFQVRGRVREPCAAVCAEFPEHSSVTIALG
jgi:hypothetical protein